MLHIQIRLLIQFMHENYEIKQQKNKYLLIKDKKKLTEQTNKPLKQIEGA